MFRFWAGESRGSEQTIVEARPPMHLLQTISLQHSLPVTTAAFNCNANATRLPSVIAPVKRRHDSDSDSEASCDAPLVKRPKRDEDDAIAVAVPGTPGSEDASFTSHLSNRKDRARDAIQFHFGLEILNKHDELRLIDQELAKCQIALEQLRRCHLIPYPVNCPTPDQVMDICDGKGPSLKQAGKEIPRWAAPFGVVDGPYARHYAKWLIPDPMFDGMLPPWQTQHELGRVKTSSEGRTTRNSIGDATLKGRPVRGNAGQKLAALTAAAAVPIQAPREKAACTLERKKDGVMVKLVCLDCHRENFLSIQGFINHCRIAHHRDFKSHEEAAIHCGHPVSPNERGLPSAKQTTAPIDRSATTPVASTPVIATPAGPFPSSLAPSGLVHPLARFDADKQDAYASLLARIKDSIKSCQASELSGVISMPSQEEKKSLKSSVVPSAEMPYLSSLMKSKNLNVDLACLVSDVKNTLDEDDYMSYTEEDLDDGTDLDAPAPPIGQSRPLMRMPGRNTMAPPQSSISRKPEGKKNLAAPMAFNDATTPAQEEPPMDEDVDMESPNTISSHPAPSLVSDDGEYDDSDDGALESDVGSENESISDLGEINIEDQGAVRFKSDDSKTVNFVGPIKNPPKERRHRNAGRTE